VGAWVRAALACAVAAAVLSMPVTAGGAGATPPYLTLLFSRTQVASAAGCKQLAGAVRLDTGVAPALKNRGLIGTGSIVPDFTAASALTCYDDRRADGTVVRSQAILGGSWATAATLRDSYRWSFISHSKSYRDITKLTASEQRAESCGTLQTFRNHGHFRADGLFAYPNNHFTSTIQSQIVSSCFAFGRRYGDLNVRSAMGPPWFAQGHAVNGGACNLASLPCYSLNTPFHYSSPVALGNEVAGLRADQWLILQGYRFLRGSLAGRYDCTASDWHAHWTTSTEEYCWDDYLRVLDHINSATRVVDPKTVATAWGR
jgi:hypothetical protein